MANTLKNPMFAKEYMTSLIGVEWLNVGIRSPFPFP